MLLNIEQRLAHLGFTLVKPSPALRPYINSYWYMRRSASSPAAPEFMHPTGGFGLIFDLARGLTLDEQPLTNRVFLDGTNTYSRRMSFTGAIEVFGIRFHPGGAYPFLTTPLVELADAPVPLDAIHKHSWLLLHEQMGTAKTLQEKIARLETWLVGRLNTKLSPLVIHSLHLIQARSGQIGMKQLADDLFISQRQLERLYQTHVGMTPKHFARLQRVEAARHALKRMREGKNSIAQISAALEYYDQAHFTHEFKAIVGMTPHHYLKR